tara:strand:- start:921 stop:1148 length:228 start_codon:yes stop_codon:yes gene_type:complete
MTKVFYLLLFLSSTTDPTYYNKGMYFMSAGECELSKPIAIEVMRREAEAVGMKDVYIDAHCIEMDVKEYKETITS